MASGRHGPAPVFASPRVVSDTHQPCPLTSFRDSILLPVCVLLRANDVGKDGGKGIVSVLNFMRTEKKAERSVMTPEAGGCSYDEGVWGCSILFLFSY